MDTGRGLSVRMHGKWLYSSRAPSLAPVQAALAIKLAPETCYVVASPCLGYGLRELVERLPESSAVLCLESHKELLLTAQKAMTELGLPAAACMLAAAADAVTAYRELEEGLAGRRFRRVIEVRLSGGRALADAVYDAAISALDQDISIRYRNRVSMVRMGRLWTKNVISNLGTIDWEDVSPLPQSNLPVVVCGAGPSLDATLPLIRQFRQDLYVLACDTATGALVKGGILPDAIVCLEGQVYNVSDFLPLDGRATRLIADLSSHPSSFRVVRGPKTLLLSEWTESAFLGRLRALGLPVLAMPPLGSVGVLALRTATMISDTLLVAGLDFSFPQGRTHCRNSPSDIRERAAQNRLNRQSSSWDASFREGTSRLAGGSISDPALAMYARLAAAELRGKNAWDLRGDRCSPLPIPALAHGDFESWLDKAKTGPARVAQTGCAIKTSQFQAPSDSRFKAAAFLRDELDLVERVSASLRSGTSRQALGLLLAGADFLYAHFPDPERVAGFSDDALKRVAAEAVYWKCRLEASLALAEKQDFV